MSAHAYESVHLVLLAGGTGTRFWPKSTAKNPKQFLSLTPEAPSLLETTLQRFSGRIPLHRTTILTTVQLQDKLKDLSEQGVRVLAEPQGRNTAPCLYWAAQTLVREDPDAVMVVLPSDHFIRDVAAYLVVMDRAVGWAREHSDLVTLGVRPSRPETGYGYLERGASLPGESRAFQIKRFIEKPSLERAEAFLSSPNYLWNGGMFVWKARALLNCFSEFLPEFDRVWESSGGDIEKAYPLLTATSIDFGIMEPASAREAGPESTVPGTPTSRVVTFELDCGWDDVGSWTAVELLFGEAQKVGATSLPGSPLGVGALTPGTVLSGTVVGVDATGNIVDVPESLVALLGVKDLIVVRANGVLMVADKHRAQDVRALVEKVRTLHPSLV